MPHRESISTDAEPATAINSPKVWAGLITNSSYLQGLLTLEYSLRKSATAYPFVALYTDSLPASCHQALEERQIPKRKVSTLRPSIVKEFGDDARFNEAWTKLAAWSLFEFERVVLLDLDMLVIRNMDELMDVELNDKDRLFAACHECTCNPMAMPNRAQYANQWPSNVKYGGDSWKWLPEMCPYTTQHANRGLAQTAGAPLEHALSYPYAMPNAGTMVIAPSLTLYNDLIAALLNSELIGKFRFSEQELLQHVFPNRWVSLPYVYNAIKTQRWAGVHDAIWDLPEVRNIHFIFKKKPWMENALERKDQSRDELHRLWWLVDGQRVEDEMRMGIANE